MNNGDGAQIPAYLAGIIQLLKDAGLNDGNTKLFCSMADLLNIIISSEKRRNLLILLRDGPQTWDTIKDRLHVTATGMLPQIKILEDEHLIRREGRVYSLSCLGMIVVHYLEPFDMTLRVIDAQKEFWQAHDMSAIPWEMLLRLSELGTIQIIESSDEEIYESHSHFQEIVTSSRSVRGMAHMVHPTYPDLFLHLAQKKVRTGLIITRKVFNIVKVKYARQLSEWLTYKDSDMYVLDEDIRLSFIITDTHLSLTLFYHNGVFDSKRDLVSTDPSALKWGEDLFSYYTQKAQKIKNLADEGPDTGSEG